MHGAENFGYGHLWNLWVRVLKINSGGVSNHFAAYNSHHYSFYSLIRGMLISCCAMEPIKQWPKIAIKAVHNE